VRKLRSAQRKFTVVYEAGPCGFGRGWRTLAGTLLIRLAPAPQSLERGSSVTHHSLDANQRAHINLIDRRHQAPPCSLSGFPRTNPTALQAADLTRLVDTRSHINVGVHLRATGAAWRTSGATTG